MPVEDWKKISADSAPPGVYRPNMSKEDMFKWKAKLVGAKKKDCKLRVEIRKTFQKMEPKSGEHPFFRRKNVYCQCLIIVSLENIDNMEDCNVLLSMNGKMGISMKEWEELELAIKEAKEVLKHIEK